MNTQSIVIPLTVRAFTFHNRRMMNQERYETTCRAMGIEPMPHAMRQRGLMRTLIAADRDGRLHDATRNYVATRKDRF